MTNEQLCRELVETAALYAEIPTPTCRQVYRVCNQASGVLVDLIWKVKKYEHVLRQLDSIDVPGAGAVLEDDWGTQEWWARRTEESSATDKESLTVEGATTEECSVDQKEVQK